MFCPSCSHKNFDEAKFCAKCGAPMRVPAASSPPPASQVISTPGGVPIVSNGMKWGITAGTVVFPLLGLVMGVIYMRDPDREKKAVGKLWLGVGIGVVVLYIISQS
jgi:hypothetical protein